MSTIREELTRIRTQLDDCFTAVSEKGISTPAQQSDRTLLNLATLIRSISQSGGSGGGTTIIIEADKADVPLGNGVYDNDAKTITWWCGNGAITIQQYKANGTTAVNQTFISAPRIYKGHILSFVCSEGIFIDEIEIKYAGQYKGNSIVLGTTTDNSGNIVNPDSNITIELDSVNDGTHLIGTDGTASAVYLQNTATASNVQLRITDIHITYHSNENS